MTAPATLADFLGHWTLARTIDDRQASRTGRLEGQATLVSQDDTAALYEEEGTLQMDGQPDLIATRRYIWQDSGQGRITVHFDDGRVFHEIELDRKMPIAEHVCDPDFYHVTYDFSRWPDWSSEWRVRGPRKDYRMVSTYRPAG